MSEPILPLRQWPAGIQQASVPANDNALRLEALSRPCLGVANDESSPNNGDVYIVGDTPAGAFSAFDEHDIALFQLGSWYAWEPVDGLRLVVNDVRKAFDGSAWIDDPSVSGGGGSDNLTLVTEASAFTADPGTHDGRRRLVLAGDDVTFDSGEPYAAGQVYNIYATGALEILVSGVTLTDVYGGTKDMGAGMAVSVVMTGATTGIIIGYTVAA